MRFLKRVSVAPMALHALDRMKVLGSVPMLNVCTACSICALVGPGVSLNRAGMQLGGTAGNSVLRDSRDMSAWRISARAPLKSRHSDGLVLAPTITGSTVLVVLAASVVLKR